MWRNYSALVSLGGVVWLLVHLAILAFEVIPS